MITLPESELAIFFSHRDTDEKGRRISRCKIKDLKTDKIVARGTSVCSNDDNFCYEVGRQISLDRAIAVYLDRMSETISTAYLNRKKG